MTDVQVYAGPSAYGLDPSLRGLPGLAWCPPARRDDIGNLVDRTPEPGVIVLADGVFHIAPAVSHAELCEALDAGWQVWGVSSLGAIRAWEMRDEGLRGWGWVHAQFACHDDYTDDEVCLLHFPEPPYFPASEPLVNLRHTLQQRGAAHGLDAAREAAVIAELRTLWFGDRTLARMADVLVHTGGMAPPAAQALLGELEQRRVKVLDLESLLRARPWLDQPESSTGSAG